VVVIEPESAAIAAAKIFALENKEMEKKILEYQEKKRREIEDADKMLKEVKK